MVRYGVVRCGSKDWYRIGWQAFLRVRVFEDFANLIGRGALRGNAPDASDQGAKLTGGDVLAKIRAGRFGDALFHQSAAEIVGSRLQAKGVTSRIGISRNIALACGGIPGLPSPLIIKSMRPKFRDR